MIDYYNLAKWTLFAGSAVCGIIWYITGVWIQFIIWMILIAVLSDLHNRNIVEQTPDDVYKEIKYKFDMEVDD